MNEPLIDMAHSELRNLLIKAARGVGMSWGLAEEAGWAGVWLAARGIPAAGFAVEWLGSELALAASPVAFGVALSDRLSAAESLPNEVPIQDGLLAPCFLIPFLHLIAQRHGAVELAGMHGTAVVVGADGALRFGVGWGNCSQGWMLRAAEAEHDSSRVLAAAGTMVELDALALKGTVPATDASRLNAGPAALDTD